MRGTTRSGFVLVVGGLVAVAIFVGAAARGSAPQNGSMSDVTGDADVAAALRVALGTEVAAIASATFGHAWSEGSSRGRFSIPLADLVRGASTRMALALALVLAAVASVGRARRSTNASDPRAPPALLQQG